MEDPNEKRLDAFESALLALDRAGLREVLALEQGNSLAMIEAEALIVPALERIGRAWEEGRVALSQIYMGGRLCEELLDELQAGKAPPAKRDSPPLAIAVLEDYHYLGMKLVQTALRSSGFEPLSYGRQEVEDLVGKVKEDGVRVLLVSVLMLRSALRVRELRSALDRAGLRVKLAVGGAPFRLDKGLWREVGADATEDSAAGAVAMTRRLLEEVSA